jgi:uncharacterized protein (DUF1778 family)
MARPKKDKDDLKNVPLRIMLTADQKELIDEAAAAMKMETSTWARPILLTAAEGATAKPRPKKQ